MIQNKIIKNDMNTFFKKFILVVIVGSIFTGCLLLFLFMSIEDTDAFKSAVFYIKNNAEINSITGGVKDVNTTFGVSYNITTNVKTNRGGKAYFRFPVKGKKDNILVKIYLSQDSIGVWQVDSMRIID
jgi:hypothetical protein